METMSRLLAIISTLLWTHAICFSPTHSFRNLSIQTTSRSTLGLPRPQTAILQAGQTPHECHQNHELIGHNINKSRQRWQRNVGGNRRSIFIGAAFLVFAAIGMPSSCSASGILSNIPTPNDLKAGLVSILDNLSHSGIKGMVVYTLSFIIWTMTVGVTTPVETAAGMAFPLQKSIPLSAIGKVGGAFFQYVLAKYLFSDYARRKMENNEWMDKINDSFQHHPYRVALIWRFSPLPEFVKNIGPALVPTLRTRYQILAILTHGLPFTVLWSCMGGEAARVARGGQPSVLLKRMVAGISWIGLVVSPTLFGMWIKGLGDTKEDSDEDE